MAQLKCFLFISHATRPPWWIDHYEILTIHKSIAEKNKCQQRERQRWGRGWFMGPQITQVAVFCPKYPDPAIEATVMDRTLEKFWHIVHLFMTYVVEIHTAWTNTKNIGKYMKILLKNVTFQQYLSCLSSNTLDPIRYPLLFVLVKGLPQVVDPFAQDFQAVILWGQFRHRKSTRGWPRLQMFPCLSWAPSATMS